MSLFSELTRFGLTEFDDLKVFEEDTKKRNTKKDQKPKEKQEMTERDYLLLKKYECPVCDWKINSLMVKAGKARKNGHDLDLRIHYEGVDPVKYDVISCPYCGYSAIASQFDTLLKVQRDQIKEQVCVNYMPDDDWEKIEEPYSYKKAITRFKLALVCAMVKRVKPSELGIISLKLHWLLESYMEELDEDSDEYRKCMEDNKECMRNAYDAFKKAFSSENLPVYGLDESTMPYMISALGYEIGEYEEAKSIIGRVITSRSANDRIKNMARDLKDMIDKKIL